MKEERMNFNDIVETIYSLPLEDRKEIITLLEHNVADSRREEIAKNFKDLENLYKKSFKEFSKFMPEKGRIVMCIPAYRSSRGEYEMLPNLDFATALGYNLVDIISPALANKLKFLRLTTRKTAIYDRKDQVVDSAQASASHTNFLILRS